MGSSLKAHLRAPCQSSIPFICRNQWGQTVHTLMLMSQNSKTSNNETKLMTIKTKESHKGLHINVPSDQLTMAQPKATMGFKQKTLDAIKLSRSRTEPTKQAASGRYPKSTGRHLGQVTSHRQFLDAYCVVRSCKVILKKRIMPANLESMYMGLTHGMTWILENNIIDLIFKTVIEYHISCCVYEPFDTLVSGSNELTQQELINALDEPKSELPIGDRSDININKPSKDIRGPPEALSKSSESATKTGSIPPKSQTNAYSMWLVHKDKHLHTRTMSNDGECPDKPKLSAVTRAHLLQQSSLDYLIMPWSYLRSDISNTRLSWVHETQTSTTIVRENKHLSWLPC
ncbi:hypothetical protein BS47DRAFT_1369217 [Hydnum rufescens UP504]|uniref:Uncharacterized protein n=1 Tax=Hydnum rufescens UP504 TaxID=1448309 RepID=A0A9P6AET5_9AGAM|nr:hypothetical protein BS47DRAFT_1369217 [Hydnum rufescens UP504]